MAFQLLSMRSSLADWTFFDEVAKEGGNVPMDENMKASPLPDLFSKARYVHLACLLLCCLEGHSHSESFRLNYLQILSSVFTVWRPTSDEAIKNMMLG
jgi:hypothetical protein